MKKNLFHIHTTIKAARKNWRIFGLSKERVMRELDEMEKEGKTLIKSSTCTNFDEKTGCRGHYYGKATKIVGI